MLTERRRRSCALWRARDRSMRSRTVSGPLSVLLSSTVWSFGMVLHECVTLQIPFHETDLFSVKEEILGGSLPTVGELASEELRPILSCAQECLVFEPEKRPAAGQLLVAMRGIQ